MKITKTVPIGRKIIRKNNLKDLANVFEEESRNCSKPPELKFTVHCVDDISFSEEKSTLFGVESKIDTHIVVSVSMEMNSYTDAKYLTLSLASSKYDRNEIYISGIDENWVLGVAGRFLDILKSIEDQNNWFLRNKKIIINISAIPLGVIPYELVFLLLQMLINKNATAPSQLSNFFSIVYFSLRGDIWFLPLCKLIGYWGIGTPFSIILYDKVTALWKEVEFDTGPEHLKKEKKLRRNISVFITLVLLPIIISILLKLID